MVSKKDIMYEIFCFKNNAENKTGRLFTDLFLSFKIYLYEVSSSKSVVLHLSIQKKKKKKKKKKNMKLQTVHLEIWSILIFSRRVLDYFSYHILCMNFQEKYFSCYIFLNDQISLSDCLYFLKYLVCLFWLFVIQFVTSWT